MLVKDDEDKVLESGNGFLLTAPILNLLRNSVPLISSVATPLGTKYV